MSEVTAVEWEQWSARLPEVHILQTAQWGSLKAAFGWEPVRVIVDSSGMGKSGVQILFRKLPFGLKMGYIAKGPVWEGAEQPPGSPIGEVLWQEVDAVCRRRRAVFLKS